MEEERGLASVREQLIIAGITELETHGMTDFSLRRVAAACNLSCAAPYKHFASKEALIEAIFAYIHQQLQFLLDQVATVFDGDPRRQLVESGVAYVRFCMANPHFRAVSTLSGNTLPLADTVSTLLTACFPHISAEELAESALVLRSIIYGTALLLESGELPNDEQSVTRLRQRLEQQLAQTE
ncbi:MAG: TetR/AcrR family transcriptional regulator [Clostridia bacterium]|nr:TetR/AcrR family transcriptional regulator [Clostridia bacterium]